MHMQWVASLGKWQSDLAIQPTHPILREAMGREVSGKQHTHCSCCTHFNMLKLRFWFSCFAHKCVFCKYPTRAHFRHFASNGIVSCSVILLYISSCQGCIAAPIFIAHSRHCCIHNKRLFPRGLTIQLLSVK